MACLLMASWFAFGRSLDARFWPVSAARTEARVGPDAGQEVIVSFVLCVPVYEAVKSGPFCNI